jgi:signal transduction histidine kinase
MQGLLLSFHVAAEKVPAGHESKPLLEKALATADRMLIEGRNRVTKLRSEHLSDGELKPAIECVADDLNVGDAVSFAAHRCGSDRVLDLHVVDEIFSIAREALANAFRHSEATRIDVELDYQPREFKMTCRDNGHGFDVNAMLLAPNVHWGLRGMTERAEKIGASFICQSAGGMGSEVRVVVPARRAYVRPEGGRWWRLSAAVGVTKTTTPRAPNEHQT